MKAVHKTDAWQRQESAGNDQPEQHARYRIFGNLLAEHPHGEKANDRSGLPQDPVERFIELENVERPPEVAVPYRRRRAESKDDDRRRENRMPRCRVYFTRDD